MFSLVSNRTAQKRHLSKVILAQLNTLSAEGEKKKLKAWPAVAILIGINMCQPQRCQGCLLRKRWGFAQFWCFWLMVLGNQALCFQDRSPSCDIALFYSPLKHELCDRVLLCCLWGFQCHGLNLHLKGNLKKICPGIFSPRFKVSFHSVSPARQLMKGFVQ